MNKNNKNLFYNIILKKKEIKFDFYNTRGQLYKVYLNKTKNSFLEPEFNYYFFSDFFRNLKYLNRQTIFKNLIKINTTDIVMMSPNYMFKSQYFSNRSLFNDLLVNFKLKGFFLYNNFFKKSNYKFDSWVFKSHIIGYSFYIFNKSSSKINFNKFINITEDKEYNGVGKVKFVFLKKTNFFLKNELNLFFNFNLYCINILEIYKIFIYLYFLKLN